MIAQPLQRLNLPFLSLDELVGAGAQADLLAAQYPVYGLPVPEWVTTLQGAIAAEITQRLAVELEATEREIVRLQAVVAADGEEHAASQEALAAQEAKRVALQEKLEAAQGRA